MFFKSSRERRNFGVVRFFFLGGMLISGGKVLKKFQGLLLLRGAAVLIKLIVLFTKMRKGKKPSSGIECGKKDYVFLSFM